MNVQRRDMTSTWLTMLSHRCRARFDRHNLIVRRSRTVHAVDWAAGLGGIEWPVPACRVGTTGWELDSLIPTANEVTCLRCLRQVKHTDLPPVATPQGAQLALPIAS